MINLKRNRTFFLAACFAMAFLSCNNSTDSAAKTVDSTAAKPADTVAVKPPVPVAEFKPFDVAEISHKVKDYAKWKPVFDADSVNRKANGLEKVVLGRGIADSNNVFIVLTVADVQKAKAFSADPKLKAAMAKGGVISKPAIDLFHIIRYNPDSKEKNWVVITHKVKDFDAWLKVYDGEGKEKRLSEGMVDIVLGRGIDDPNIVHIAFDITDMAKAKAALSSEEKKKLMMSAGVIGAPKIVFYTSAE